MILWLLLFNLLSYAQEQDQTFEEYCFASESIMKQTHERLKFILVPNDKAQEEKNCLTISSRPHRRELIQNYIRRIAPEVRIGFSSAELKREPCHLKIEKSRAEIKNDLSASGHFDPHGPRLSLDALKAERGGLDIISIQTLKEFELTVNQDVIKGECRSINSNRYEISLEVRKDATPVSPPIPSGAIIVAPNSPHPGDQQLTSKLQTTMQLSRGDRIEIGSVVKALRVGQEPIYKTTHPVTIINHP